MWKLWSSIRIFNLNNVLTNKIHTSLDFGFVSSKDHHHNHLRTRRIDRWPERCFRAWATPWFWTPFRTPCSTCSTSTSSDTWQPPVWPFRHPPRTRPCTPPRSVPVNYRWWDANWRFHDSGNTEAIDGRVLPDRVVCRKTSPSTGVLRSVPAGKDRLGSLKKLRMPKINFSFILIITQFIFKLDN